MDAGAPIALKIWDAFPMSLSGVYYIIQIILTTSMFSGELES